MDQRKHDIVKKALQEGLITDPQWLNKLEEPMPVWAVAEMMVKLLEKLDPPSISYD